MSARRAAALAAAALLAVYAATLAPGVTFWDAGEFIAAAHSLGIPHPPGTPLFVLALHVWASALGGMMPYATATNLFSACCTAAAAGMAGWLVARGRTTDAGATACAAALGAGGMSTIWLNATETEVYAAALLLAVLTLVAADRASRERGMRWLALTAYLVVLAVPLHLSALVVTPAAVVLAAQREEGVDWERGLLLGGVWLLAVGAGRVSVPVMGAALIVLGAACVAWAWRNGARRGGAVGGALLGVSALALSAVLFMLVRARFDPFINQGNPSNWAALLDVVARRQYDVAALWPRQAPVWLQLANVAQYADWQVALGLGPTVLPSLGRTLATVAFLGLGVYGAARHRLDDARMWRAVLTLLICGSIGVAAYLNLKAGPSIGAGVLPPSAPHEARERDYFFTFAFLAWGLWIGYGVVALARRWRLPVMAGLATAALPVALNWPAVSRRAEPEAKLPATWARMLLDATPARGVLIAAGDNDTYPVWYLQEVQGYRRDVRVVTLPLLPAAWYRAELHRRGSLLPASAVAEWDADDVSAAMEIARRAEAEGRPVAVSVYVDRSDRDAIGRAWRANGMTFVLDTAAAGAGREVIEPDTAWAARLAGVARPVVARQVRASTDPAAQYFQSLTRCPGYLVARTRGAVSQSLDSLCNFR